MHTKTLEQVAEKLIYESKKARYVRHGQQKSLLRESAEIDGISKDELINLIKQNIKTQ